VPGYVIFMLCLFYYFIVMLYYITLFPVYPDLNEGLLMARAAPKVKFRSQVSYSLAEAERRTSQTWRAPGAFRPLDHAPNILELRSLGTERDGRDLWAISTFHWLQLDHMAEPDGKGVWEM
jgi:hypothetical protein